jgi:hypothetical protein
MVDRPSGLRWVVMPLAGAESARVVAHADGFTIITVNNPSRRGHLDLELI